MAKTILAIGGHIGDACLTAGGVMASNAVEGGKNYTLALTAGEKGNPPHMTREEYKKQKIQEAKNFMAMMNGEAYVLDYGDGELPNDEKEVATDTPYRWWRVYDEGGCYSSITIELDTKELK
jgi:LmbE family N-acetylglucosaminyl deacetylase